MIGNMMNEMLYPEIDHEQVREKVRTELGHRITRLMDKYEVFLDDDPRDFSPGQVANYLTAAKILGALYQSFKEPVDKSGMIPADKVEKMIEAATAQAVAEALELERARIASERLLALESAGTGVRAALSRERDRQTRKALGS